MTTLDASVLVSYFGDDVHTDRAHDLLGVPMMSFRLHPATLAEVLTGPAHRGLETAVRTAVDELRIDLSIPEADEPVQVARLRASTGLKLPDCYVLALAEQTGSALATFDERLTAVARDRGLTVVGAS
ncbi:type II toxin-antitoxin system VapC family toxin [Microbacterium sp.]|uniref:type II toxin-antitoxin system VapC family toxin n=1 Tax=Microbacterium sp. TaxID=51671 RepID=UPI0039E27830